MTASASHEADAQQGMLDILTAHVAHETGNGDQMFGYNFGGIKGPVSAITS